MSLPRLSPILFFSSSGAARGRNFLPERNFGDRTFSLYVFALRPFIAAVRLIRAVTGNRDGNES